MRRSASAFFVTQTLRGLANDKRTVIASIHQPSSEVFELFDRLCLLSGGKTIYFGEASQAYEASFFFFNVRSHYHWCVHGFWFSWGLLAWGCCWEECCLLYIMQFFAAAGFPCPDLVNPSDHFIRCINSDFDQVRKSMRPQVLISLPTNFLLELIALTM